jgi:hypothetical protein
MMVSGNSECYLEGFQIKGGESVEESLVRARIQIRSFLRPGFPEDREGSLDRFRKRIIAHQRKNRDVIIGTSTLRPTEKSCFLHYLTSS